jgi:hypothetical protein
MVLELEKANGSLQEQCQNQDKISVNLDEQVDHLLSIKQTLSSEKKNAEKKKAKRWAFETMCYHIQVDKAKNYASRLRGITQQIADGEPMAKDEFQ